MRIFIYARYTLENQDEENIDPTCPENKFLKLSGRSATMTFPISSQCKDGQQEVDVAHLFSSVAPKN